MTMRILGLLVSFVALALQMSGCAAGMKAPQVSPAEAAQARDQAAEEGEYERLLGTFSVNPDLVIYLNPAICERYLVQTGNGDDIAQIVDQFGRIGAARGEAAARLNWGVVFWYDGEAEYAYREMMNALQIFAEIGDVDGLAHTYEWLGYFFKQSGAIEEAGEHLAVAYQLFEKLSNQPAAERVLSYADD